MEDSFDAELRDLLDRENLTLRVAPMGHELRVSLVDRDGFRVASDYGVTLRQAVEAALRAWQLSKRGPKS